MGLPGSPVIKNPPAVQETQVQSLGWEDPLEESMATHSSVLAWGIPWTEEPGSPWCCKESDMTEATEHTLHTHTHTQMLSLENFTLNNNSPGIWGVPGSQGVWE